MSWSPTDYISFPALFFSKLLHALQRHLAWTQLTLALFTQTGRFGSGRGHWGTQKQGEASSWRAEVKVAFHPKRCLPTHGTNWKTKTDQAAVWNVARERHRTTAADKSAAQELFMEQWCSFQKSNIIKLPGWIRATCSIHYQTQERKTKSKQGLAATWRQENSLRF